MARGTDGGWARRLFLEEILGEKKSLCLKDKSPCMLGLSVQLFFIGQKKTKKNNPAPKQGPVTSSSMRGFVCKLEIFDKPDEAFHLSAIHFGASSSFDVSASDVWTSPSDKSDH